MDPALRKGQLDTRRVNRERTARMNALLGRLRATIDDARREEAEAADRVETPSDKVSIVTSAARLICELRGELGITARDDRDSRDDATSADGAPPQAIAFPSFMTPLHDAQREFGEHRLRQLLAFPSGNALMASPRSAFENACHCGGLGAAGKAAESAFVQDAPLSPAAINDLRRSNPILDDALLWLPFEEEEAEEEARERAQWAEEAWDESETAGESSSDWRPPAVALFSLQCNFAGRANVELLL